MNDKKADSIILYLVKKYNGNWDSIYNAIKNKEPIDDEMYQKIVVENESKYITILNNEYYPSSLKQCIKPPFLLFYKGNIDLLKEEPKKLISVVGTRNATTYGLEMTENIIKNLDNKFIIVSGLAKGIDASAHLSALNSNKKTIAILPCGIDCIYPQENEKLYESIKKEGLILSEYPDSSEPLILRCKERNRIVAALSKLLLVTEAYGRSGTSITVNYALQNGKDIACVPTKANLNSKCNSLIKEGAYLVENSRDLENLIEF